MKPTITTKDLPMLPGHDGVEHRFVNSGDSLANYTQKQPHTAMLVSGKLLVETDGIEPVEYTGPVLLKFSSGAVYSLTAMEPETIMSSAVPKPVKKKNKK